MNSYKALLISGLFVGVVACKADNLIVGEGDGYDSGLGGQGDPVGAGGNLGAGGVLATGGVEDLGGSMAAGGAMETGGVVAAGGAMETGGVVAAGGAMETGGVVSAGGAVSTGGDQGVGGEVGATGGGGATTPTTAIPSGTVVSFVNGMAKGAMMGVGWVDMGTIDSVSSPTCLGGVPISNAAPCTTQTLWNNPSALCVTGSLPALPAAPTQADYANNWGIMVGVNAREPSGVIGLSFGTITLSLSGASSTGLRAEIHRQGDPDSTWYCANLQTDMKISLTTFNTSCWDGTGTNLTLADVRKIDKISVQVLSGYTAVSVTNLCLNRIIFGN